MLIKHLSLIGFGRFFRGKGEIYENTGYGSRDREHKRQRKKYADDVKRVQRGVSIPILKQLRAALSCSGCIQREAKILYFINFFISKIQHSNKIP